MRKTPQISMKPQGQEVRGGLTLGPLVIFLPWAPPCLLLQSSHPAEHLRQSVPGNPLFRCVH